MKFFIVFAICVAAASARFVIPSVVADEVAEIQQILDAINHPSTDPATAAALEQMLQEVLGIAPHPIDVGPAIVEEFKPTPVVPTPVVPIPVVPAPEVPSPVVPAIPSSPLVQIIVNVKPSAGNPVSVEGVNPSPVIVAPSPQPEVVPTPVIVVDQPEVVPTPVIVVDQPEVVPTPVIVVEQPQVEVEPTPVIVVDQPAIIPEPVLVAPIIPSPVVVLPDILN